MCPRLEGNACSPERYCGSGTERLCSRGPILCTLIVAIFFDQEFQATYTQIERLRAIERQGVLDRKNGQAIFEEGYVFFRGRFVFFCVPGSMFSCFCAVLLLCFSASLLLCFSAFPASLLVYFSAFLLLLFCFSAFLLFLLFAFPASLLVMLPCFSALPASFLFCFSAFPASLLFCFCASVPLYFCYSN